MEVSVKLHTPDTLPPPVPNDVSQSPSGCFGEEKNLSLLCRIKPWLLSYPACSIGTIPTELSWQKTHTHTRICTQQLEWGSGKLSQHVKLTTTVRQECSKEWYQTPSMSCPSVTYCLNISWAQLIRTCMYIWVYNIAIHRKNTKISEKSTCGPRGVFWLSLIPTTTEQYTLESVTIVSLSVIHLLADYGKGFSQYNVVGHI